MQAIRLGRQVELAGEAYDPLVEVNGLPCWPSEPDWQQIRDADRMKGLDFELPGTATVCEQRLERGSDFDTVLLGIPIGAHATVCRELIDADSRWRAMVENVRTVPTLGVQLWMSDSLEQLGWADPPTIGSSYPAQLCIWANSTELLPRETWPADGPRSVIYLCGTLAYPAESGDPPLPIVEQQSFDLAGLRVREAAERWLTQHTGLLWPRATQPDGALRWDLLYDPAGGTGPERLAAQVNRANVSPSELYVMTVPGSTRFRLKAGESGCDNLVLTGDWIDNDYIRCGFIEGAVVAGLSAARVISEQLLEASS